MYGIISRSGGHARFYSRPGVGTAFVALLPALQAPESTLPQDDAPTASTATGSATILVVEDEPPLREVVRRILTEAGHEVLVASGGEEALEVVRDHPERIDLLLSDMVMPGMLGHQLAERLQELRPDIGVLYMSGFSESVVGTVAAQPSRPRSSTSRSLRRRCWRRSGARWRNSSRGE